MSKLPLKQRYLASKENAWSYASYKSEASRLASIPDEYLPNDPASFYRYCVSNSYKPYTIKTLFIRAAQLAGFGWPDQVNQYTKFMQENARLFKNAYTPKRPQLSFSDAVTLIKANLSPDLAAQALALLSSGLRISEANNVKNGVVIGKGSKPRQVHNAPEVTIVAHQLRRALKPLGLTPHSLRKLAATRAVELGAREAELLAMFGWNSMQTASLYVTAANTASLAAKMKEGVSV
jgi:integrase